VVVEDEDGCPIYADTAGAAKLLAHVGVTTARIRDWKRRGLITPAHVIQGRPIYRMADVWAAEKATRTRRTRPRCLTFAS
jgi:DNA-binding transcriptional MerR regulator